MAVECRKLWGLMRRPARLVHLVADRRYARSQYVTNAEACERFAAGIHEEMSILLLLNAALFEVAE